MKVNMEQLKQRLLARQEELIERVNEKTEMKYELTYEGKEIGGGGGGRREEKMKKRKVIIWKQIC